MDYDVSHFLKTKLVGLYCQNRMEPRADLQQRSNPPLNLNLPRTLRRNPRKNLEQRALARAIPPDDPKNLPALHLK